MHLFHFKRLCHTFLFMVLAFSCFELLGNQNNCTSQDTIVSSYYVNPKPKSNYSPTWLLLNLGYHTPRGIGYHSGYSTAGVTYFPSMMGKNFQPFIDGRYHIFDEGRSAANGGIGFRYLIPDCCQAIGFNIYYDYRNTDFRNYNQVSIGTEWFSNCLDLFFNAYVPLERNHSPYKKKEFTFPGGYFAESRKFNYSFDKYELIAGHRMDFIPILNFFKPYLTAGVYYIGSLNNHHREHHHHRRSALGSEWRLATEYFRNWTIQCIASYDKIFKGRVQMYIGFYLPMGRGCSTSCKPCDSSEILLDKIYTTPFRSDIIPVKKGCHLTSNF